MKCGDHVVLYKQCWITNDKVIKENDVRNWFRQDFEEYKDNPYSKAKGKFPWDKDYHIFPLSAYIHSGVLLSMRSSFPCDPQGWDTSTCGVVMASKKEWRMKKSAMKAAQSKVEEWNMYLSGDVWGVIQEYFDKEKNQVDHDSCWGYYGYEYAMEELKANAQWIDDKEKKRAGESVGNTDTNTQQKGADA